MTGSMAFSQQPGTIITGNNFSPAVTVTITPAATDALAISAGNQPSCVGVLTGTLTATANGSGVATFTGVGATGSGNCTLIVTDTTNMSGMIPNQTSSLFAINATPATHGHAGRRRLKK